MPRQIRVQRLVILIVGDMRFSLRVGLEARVGRLEFAY